MKRFLVFLTFAFALWGLWACTADYDTFSKSHYKTFNSIVFDEQDGDPSVYADEHLIKVTLVVPPESLTTWDSVTVASFDVSSLASIHLVDGKFKEFPSDSAALDSLANAVSYASKKIHVGDKIRIPKNLVVYIVVVAENGDPSIWQMSFTIPGVEVASSSSAAEEGDDNGQDGDESDISSSSSSAEEDVESSSSSVTLSDNNSLKISFKEELENKTSGDTIYVTFAQGTDLSKVELDQSEIHRAAKIEEDPSKVSDWSKVKTFVVTAEDGSERTWVVVTQAILSSATDFQIWFKNQLKVNRNGDTIAVKLVNSETVGEAVVDSFKVSTGAKLSPEPKDVKWSELQKFTVTAEDGSEKVWILTIDVAAADEKASDEKELLSISAKDEVKTATIDVEKKTVVLHLANQEALAAVNLTVKISETASQNLQTGALDLRTPVVMTITAEDASTAVWTISADYPLSSEADVKTFSVEGVAVDAGPVIDASKHEISFEVPYGTDLSDVYFTATYSDKAKKKSPSENAVNLTSGSAKIVVVAENGDEVEWTVKVKVGEAPVVLEAPRIRSMKIDGKDAVVDSVKENGKWIHWIHYDNLEFRSDLSKLKISDIKLSDGAEITGVADGSSYDLGTGVKATVSNGSESLDYEIRAGYQYPNSSFETWSGNKPSDWDNGNQSGLVNVTITSSTSSGNGKAVYMQTKKAPVVNTLASGNLFIGVMNPKGVAATSMLSYKDGNELIDFGKPFAARPKYMELDIKYTGKNDSCDVYLLLENRTSTKTCTNGSTAGSNVCRTSSDVNTLVASAWYRSTSDNDLSDPDVISISEPNATTGLRTLRMKLKYGEPYAASPIMNVGSDKGSVSTLYSGALLNSKGIDNHLIVGDGTLPVTHIRAVFAASADGNHYSGTEGAVFIVDNFKLIY